MRISDWSSDVCSSDLVGIGGTGVVTIGAVLAMAAHLEGKTASIIDITGLSQKNGAVSSHLRIGPADQEVGAARIPAAGADVLLGCDKIGRAAWRARGGPYGETLGVAVALKKKK